MDFKLKSETVNFEDSTGKVVGTVIVHEATLPMDQELDEMEQAFIKLNDAEFGDGENISNEMIRFHSFRLNLYPKMVACSTGDIPAPDEAFRMPSRQLNKWWEAAKRVNPAWFEVFDNLENLSEDQKKKKEKKPVE